MSNYLLELAVIHSALILGYLIILRKERQYAKMRFYLLASTLLSLIIPLLKLPRLFIGFQELMGRVEVGTLEAVNVVPATEYTLGFNALFVWVYLLVSLVLLLKFLSGLFQLVLMERRSNYEKFNDHYVRRVRDIRGSFTFFNWIFLGDRIDREQEDYPIILKHEKAHVSLGHSYDILFFELFRICFWWLPSVWYILKEIRKIHEYQADAYALKSYNVEHYSSVLAGSVLRSNGLELASSFHDGLILKRLKAMKQQAKNVSPWKLGALSALFTLLFIAFACSEELDNKSDVVEISKDEAEGEVFTEVETLPAYKGGMESFYRYMANEIKYPPEARQLGIEGKVLVQFVVEKDGSVTNVEALKGIGSGCDEEAVRVVKNIDAFNPGLQRGRPVRVQMVLPILFKLKEG